MTAFYLLFVMMMPLFSVAVMDLYSNETQWLIYDIGNMLTCILLSIAVFSLIPYRNVMLKTLSLLCVVIHVWWAMDYALLEMIPALWVRNVNDLVFIFIAIPTTLNILMRPYNSTVKYRADGIFSVYKKPHNFLGVLAALITTPYGSRSVVKNGVEFIFKDGTLIGRTYKPSKNHCYVEINDIDIEKEVGARWSWLNNCFTFYRKLDGKERRRKSS